MKFTEALENYAGVFEQIGKNKWRTLQEIVWYVDYQTKNEYRIIPKGFHFNGGSVPALLHFVVDDDDYPFAFCGHDFDYSGKSEYHIVDIDKMGGIFQKHSKHGTFKSQLKGATIFIPDRKFADLMLKDAIHVEGLSKLRAFLVYLGVRLGGRRHFLRGK